MIRINLAKRLSQGAAGSGGGGGGGSSFKLPFDFSRINLGGGGAGEMGEFFKEAVVRRLLIALMVCGAGWYGSSLYQKHVLDDLNAQIAKAEAERNTLQADLAKTRGF